MTLSPDIQHQLADALARGEWPRARMLSSQWLARAPQNAHAHFAAGLANLEMRAVPAALPHLQRAVELAPECAPYLLHLARALAASRRPNDARAAAGRAMAQSPDAATLTLLGAVYADIEAYPEALDAYQRAAAASPDQALHHYNVAAACVAMGDVEAAERAIDACLAIDPQFARAHATLAHLRKQTAASNHVERLGELLASPTLGDNARISLEMALAKECDDLGQYALAFEHLSQGKAIARRSVDYSSARDQALFDGVARAFPQPPSQSPGSSSDEPIFVFGMPRSGTTLVERILTSHPHVQGTGELLNFGMALRKHWGRRPPIWQDMDIAAHAATVDWRAVGDAYVESVRPEHSRTPRFVDKFPFNFLYAGFIARALPHARMVCLRRHPMDTCLGNFRQLFAEKLPYYDYSFDLLDGGRYYVMFDRLMAHWRQVFPGRILELDYEALVSAPETTTRELLAFCGLPWNDACLRPDTNQTGVATASALQVREPIHRRAMGHWRHYEAQLAPLRALLEQAGIEVDPQATQPRPVRP
jgi:tetratricopeptide (TPR) repeat protein